MKEALIISPIKFKPAILFNLYQKEKDSSKQIEYLDSIVQLIIQNNLKTTKNLEFEKIKFNYKLLREIQLQIFKMGKIETFLDLIEYEKTKISRYKDTVIILDKLIGVAQELDYPIDFIYKLTEFLYNKCEDKNSDIFKNALILLSTLNLDTYPKYAIEYLKFLDQETIHFIDFTDIAIYINLIQRFSNKKDLNNAFEIVNTGERLKFKLSDDLKNSILIFDFFKMKYQVELGLLEEPKKAALDILNQLKTFEDQYLKNPIIRQIGIQNIINYCQNTLSTLRKNVPFQSHKKLGRNDQVKVKYKNGDEILIKYKKVEFDLKNGKCILIN